MSTRQGVGLVIGALLLISATAGGALWLLQEESGCDSLSSSAPAASDGAQRYHRLVIEAFGNTPAWQDEIAEFVEAELLASGTEAPEVALVVDTVVVVDGKALSATATCIGRRVVLAPAAGDLETLESASESTREITLQGMEATRRRQIGWVAEAARSEVASLSFDSTDSTTISPVPVWARAAEPGLDGASTQIVSVYSPMASTAGDCLDDGDASSSEEELVVDCLAFEQLGVLDADLTRISVAAVANPSQAQLARAERLADALCREATRDGCTLENS